MAWHQPSEHAIAYRDNMPTKENKKRCPHRLCAIVYHCALPYHIPTLHTIGYDVSGVGGGW